MVDARRHRVRRRHSPYRDRKDIEDRAARPVQVLQFPDCGGVRNWLAATDVERYGPIGTPRTALPSPPLPITPVPWSIPPTLSLREAPTPRPTPPPTPSASQQRL